MPRSGFLLILFSVSLWKAVASASVDLEAGVAVEAGAEIALGVEVTDDSTYDGPIEWSDDCECHLGDNEYYDDILYMKRRYQDYMAVRDFENYALHQVDDERLHYFNIGSDNQTTRFENERAFQRLRLRPRVLRHVGVVDTTTNLQGDDTSFPLGIGPQPLLRWVDPDGEIGVARAAECEGVPYIVSAFSNTDLEDIAAAARHANLWMETYIFADRSVTQGIVQRAEAAGYRTIVVSANLPVFGNYVELKRDHPLVADYLQFPNIDNDDSNGHALKQIALVKGPGYFRTEKVDQRYERLSQCIGTFGHESLFNYLIDPEQSWEDIRFIRKLTVLPLVVRGVMNGCDAIRAVENGANGIIISNNGGKDVDTAPAAIEALAEVLEAVDVYQNVEVYVEGGVRWGTDIFKALAMGADAVFLGRPTVYGLFHSGKCGVRRTLQILRREFERDMAFMGTKHVDEITSTMCVSELYYEHRYRPSDVEIWNNRREDRLECPFGYDYDEDFDPSLEDVRELRPVLGGFAADQAILPHVY